MPKPSPDTWMWTLRSLLMAPAVRSLRIGCCFIPRNQPQAWFPVVEDPRRLTLVDFEVLHGLERDRNAYNDSALAVVRRTKRRHVAHRGGMSDIFVPVLWDGRLNGVLACGPVLTRRPTLASLLSDWQHLTGTPADPENETFLGYVRSVLDCHVFEGPALAVLEKYLEDFAHNMSGKAPTGRPLGEDRDDWNLLRTHVAEARRWEVAAELVDPERNAVWAGAGKDVVLAYEGLTRSPTHVAVVVPKAKGTDTDSASSLLRIDALQRVCAAFALEMPDTIAGRTGEGAFFLTHVAQDRALVDFWRRVSRHVREKLGIEVACGFGGRALYRGELPQRYDEALYAVLSGEAPGAPDAVFRSGRALCDGFVLGDRRETGVRLERVVREALRASRANVEALRSHLLDVLWELFAVIERSDVVDRRTWSEMLKRFTARLQRPSAVVDVASMFQLLAHELLELVLRPAALRTKARLERARRFVERAGPETPVDLERVARQVGLSASHFSRCFKRTYKTGFARFVLHTRIERSKELLRGTALAVSRVSTETGWSSPSYFHQAFRRMVGMTPAEYRHAAGRPEAPPHR